jgi:hypothetical protein
MSAAVIVHPVSEEPTLAGFTAWVYAFMGVPKSALPPDSPYLQLSYDTSVNVAYVGLKLVKNRSPPRTPPHPEQPIYPAPPGRRFQSPSIYALAVYNLGGHILCNTAMDDPDAVPPQVPPTFWADLRTKLNLNSFSLGLITSAADQGTSAGQMIPDMIQNMSLMNLWLLQTPWGRMYLMLAGQWGTIWGKS